MKIGLGTAAIGRPHYINIRAFSNDKPFDKTQFIKDGKKMLSSAYNGGVRHFDSAPGYGIAEQILLEWIHENDITDITISTKWGYTYVADFNPEAAVHEVKEHSLKKLNEQWRYSAQFLPLINVYQIHSATLDSGVLENIEVLNRLFELKNENDLVIGLSASGENQNEIIEKALAIEVNGQQLFDSFQITYNVFDQSLAEIKHLLKGKKIIVKEALANGRVFPNDSFSHYSQAYEVLSKLADKYKVGIDAIALRFCIDSIDSYMVLSGASEGIHLKANLLAESLVLSAEDIALLQTVKVKPEDYWLERKGLAWN